MFIFVAVLGLLLIWQSRRNDRLEQLEQRMKRMQRDIGLLERQVLALRDKAHVHVRHGRTDGDI
jgi:type II secretory pathway component PulJ